MRTFFLVALFWSQAATPHRASQEVLKVWQQSSFPGTSWPRLLPDMNSDGVRELLVGSGTYDSGGVRDVGIVAVHSGNTTEQLFAEIGEAQEGFYLGNQIVTVGDMNGDGRRDYAASARGNKTYIFDGSDGKVLYEHAWRSDRIKTLGDLDRDGFDDVAFSIKAVSTISVWVVRGGTFQLAFALSVPPENPGYFDDFGLDFGALGDIDRDGFGDFVTSQNWISSKRNFNGWLHAYSGRDGRSLYSVEIGGDGGYAIEAMGDLNSNGTVDLAVQWSGNEIGFLEGSDCSEIAVLSPPTDRFDLGDYIVVIGDVNGNGCPDLITNTRRYNPRRNRYESSNLLVDGGTREFLLEFEKHTGIYDAGFDWNEDGLGDFLQKRDALLEVVSLAPPWATVFGKACSPVPDEHLRILASGEPRVGGAIELRLADAKPDRDAFLVLASHSDTHAFWRPVMGGCSLAFAPQGIRPARTATTGCGSAGAALTVAIPNLPSFVGTRFQAQWLVSTGLPRAWATTRAMEIQLD